MNPLQRFTAIGLVGSVGTAVALWGGRVQAVAAAVIVQALVTLYSQHKVVEDDDAQLHSSDTER